MNGEDVSAMSVHRVTVRLSPTHLERGGPVVDRHVRVALPAPHPWPLLADVLVAPGTDGSATDTLAATHPGAAVVAVYDGSEACRLRLGPYGRVPVRLILGARHAAVCPWHIWASLAHAWLSAGLDTTELGSVAAGAVVTTTGQAVIRLRGRPSQPPASSSSGPVPRSERPVSETPSPAEALCASGLRSRSRTSSAAADRFTAT